MANALIFMTMLGLIVPLINSCIFAYNSLFTFLNTLQGFSLMFDVIKVLDCCLPFSLITLFQTASNVGLSVGVFLLARKAATMVLGLFGSFTK